MNLHRDETKFLTVDVSGLFLGAGKHESTLTKPGAFAKVCCKKAGEVRLSSHHIFQASYAYIVLYRPSIAAVKISVLLLYRRIFPQKRFRTLLYWYGGFVLVYTTIFATLDIFHCSPVDRAWSTLEKSSCLSMNTIWVIGGSLNAVTDIAALCLPMPLLWHLQVTKEKRLELIGVFLLGGL